MNPNRLRSLPAAGIVVSLLVAASPAGAHDYRHGHARPYVHPYRPAVLVVPPRVVSYGHAGAAVHYAPPPPVYTPAYYVPAPVYRVPRIHYGPSLSIGIYAGGRGYVNGHGHR